MITTVTEPYLEALMSASISTSTASAMSEALFTSVGLVLLVTLIFLLILKEVLTTSVHPRAEQIRRTINVAVLPLGISVIITAVVTVSQFFY